MSSFFRRRRDRRWRTVLGRRATGQGEEDLVERRPAQADVVELDVGGGEQAHRIGEAGGAVVDGHGHPARRVVDPRLLAPEWRQQLDGVAQVVGPADADLDDVASGQRLQLIRRAGGDRPAMVDDDHVVGQLIGLLEVLRGQQHVSAAADERPDRLPQLDPAPRVEPGRRLVEEQESRRADEARAEVEAATHATRVVAHEAVTIVGQTELGSTASAARRASARRCPNRRATITRFSRPVSAGSTAACWPARPMTRRTSSGRATASMPAT